VGGYLDPAVIGIVFPGWFLSRSRKLLGSRLGLAGFESHFFFADYLCVLSAKMRM